MKRARKTPQAVAARHEPRLWALIPPEGAPLHFEIASLGARFGAQIADILLTGGAALALLLLALLSNAQWLLGGGGVFFILLLFFVRAPYYIIAELLWNGRTLGKRMIGLRVVSADGRGLTPYSIVARNLMKEAEIFAPGSMLFVAADMSAPGRIAILVWISILLLVPLFNKRRQRLGDMVAGTVVVNQPVAALLPDLAAVPAAQDLDARFAFRPDQLDHYGRFELQTLETLLRAQPGHVNAATQNNRRKTVAAVVEKIRRKIDYVDRVPLEDYEAFLSAFYKAQRAYLEQKQLFGDVREDKYSREALKENAGSAPRNHR